MQVDAKVSIININNSITKPYGYPNSNTSPILIFDGYVKVTKSLYTQIVFRSITF